MVQHQGTKAFFDPSAASELPDWRHQARPRFPPSTSPRRRSGGAWSIIRSRAAGELFDGDPGRAERYVVDVGDLRVDYSKNAVDDAMLTALLDVAAPLASRRAAAAMFAGEQINVTEDRAVLHTALRAPAGGRRASTA